MESATVAASPSAVSPFNMQTAEHTLDPDPLPSLPQSPKRPLDEAQSKPVLAVPSTNHLSRQQSPALSTISTLTSMSVTPPPPQLDGTADLAAPAAKRRKLTPAEKEARDQEKAEKRARKEQEKQAKELVKDEERRKKAEAQQEKTREKEEKQREKELKKSQEEEEKAKKERAQSRINAFFVKPKPSIQSDNATLACSSLAPSPKPDRKSETIAPDLSGVDSLNKSISDYAKTFFPFAAPSNSMLAPHNRFSWDEEAAEYARKYAESWFSPEGLSSKFTDSLQTCLDLSPVENGPWGFIQPPTRQILARVEDSSNDVVGTTDLRELPMKYIFFHQDIRPPYIGTANNFRSRKEAFQLARNPFKKARTELDYDYDSEAEWEEPEEGEDLESEGEEELDSEGEEMDEFLDDEDAEDGQKLKRRFLNSDMQPISTGVCWEDGHGKLPADLMALTLDPADFRMETLIDSGHHPIDPFSQAYWMSNAAPTTQLDLGFFKKIADTPRIPLQARPNIAINGLSPPSLTESTKPGKSPKPLKAAKPDKPVRLLTGPDLEEFKRLINGSDLNKQGLLAVAKKRLPKVKNAVLSDTLGTIAARVGLKEADKRWILLNAPTSSEQA